MNSAPTEGVRVVPVSQVKSTFPVLKSPANRHKAIPLSLDEFKYAFTNTFTDEESQALYERYAIPANGGILWGSVLANFQPGHQDTWVDYHNDNRVPLLFVSGSEDHIMPPEVQRSNAKHYKSNTVTEVSCTRGTRICCPRKKAGRRSRTRYWTGLWPRRPVVTQVRITHIGGPTTLIEVDGLRLLTDPTFDPPGRRYTFGWGSASTKVAGPAVVVATCRRSTPYC